MIGTIMIEGSILVYTPPDSFDIVVFTSIICLISTSILSPTTIISTTTKIQAIIKFTSKAQDMTILILNESIKNTSSMA